VPLTEKKVTIKLTHPAVSLSVCSAKHLGKHRPGRDVCRAKSSKIISRQKGREPTLRCQTPHLYLHAHAIVSQKGAQKQLQILISRAILLACLSGLRRSLPIFVRGESALWLRI